VFNYSNSGSSLVYNYSNSGSSLVYNYSNSGSSLVYQLLDFEARSGEQVPLLLKMKRSQLALSKAVESGDTDLGECLLAPPTICLSGHGHADGFLCSQFTRW